MQNTPKLLPIFLVLIAILVLSLAATFWLASVSTPEGELRASALRSAPHYLLVQSEPLCELALELLAKSLAERGAVHATPLPRSLETGCRHRPGAG